jgi:hypothetical protein
VSQVTALLGREPRGLEEIAVARPDGGPVVIRVASLVDDQPCPALFWRVDAELNYRIDQEEAGGLIAQFQQRIDSDPDLQTAMRGDHESSITLRDGYLSPALREELVRRGFGEVLGKKGIGGIADCTRIRCLHTWYAAHLVEPNTVGRMLDDYWQAQEGGNGPT